MTIVALLCLIAPAGAPTEHLTGKVLSEEGGGVAGVEVVAESGEVARTVVSGQDGTFTFDELWPGHYRVTASAPYRAPGAAEVRVPAESFVTVAVGAVHIPPDLHPAGGLLSGLPVESRTPAAALRLGFAARARAGTRARFAGAYGGPEWTLDGFDFTHPITGQPLVAIGLAGVVALSASETSSGAWGAGPAGELTSRQGSNRLEGGLSASAGPGAAGTLEGNLSCPLVRDHLWYGLSAGAAWRDPERTRSAGEGLAHLTWQVNPRNKLSLVAAADASGVEASRATFGGLKWESLLADNLVLLATGSGFDDSSPLKMVAGSARLSWFPGEHALEADARLAVVGVVYRPHLRLEDQWRPSRHFTVGGWYTQAALPHGSGGGLSLTWDATHDGRTAVRARASTTAVPGLLAPVEPPTRVEEAALGYEREVAEGNSLGLEVLHRRARSQTSERETLLALHAQHRSGASFKGAAMYLARLTPTFHSELTAVGSVALGRGISAGGLVVYGPRASWLPLFDEARGAPLGPGDGGSGWLLGIQVRADLGWLVGQSTALWLDALNLTGDRAPITAALRTPPRQLKLNLRIEL